MDIKIFFYKIHKRLFIHAYFRNIHFFKEIFSINWFQLC